MGNRQTWPEKHQFHISVTLNPSVLHISAASLPPREQGHIKSLLFSLFIS